MAYTDVFGNQTLPPSEYGYSSLVIVANATLVWPFNTDDSTLAIAKIMNVSCGPGNVVTLPDATEVSTGEDFLLRNVGANTLTVKDSSGVQIATVAVGAASYFYLTNNTTAAGVFGVIGFGVGTSTVDAASLVGYGIKAIGASLNQSHPVVPTNTGITLGSDHRSKLVTFTGGVATFDLTSAATLGDDYFTLFRNQGTGTVTLDPASAETIDGMATMQVQPGESLMLICTGTQWYTVGYGRSTLYQFTQLTKDVSGGGTITLTATEAANKLITFIGNPAGAVTVVVPSIVAVYYTQSSISTAQTITLKTAAGTGIGLTQGSRIIALCDGTNVVAAQSATANASLSLIDGSAAVPSLFFASKTNTGLFKSGTQDLGVTVNGTLVGIFGSTGLQIASVGPNSSQQHLVPAVASDVFALVTASQVFNNKSINLTTNTLSGTLAQFNTACSDADFASLAGAEILTNKTLNLANNTLTGTLAQFNTACSDADFASIASPTFTGDPKAPTPAVNDNDTSIATTAYVFAERANTITLTNKTLAAATNTVEATSGPNSSPFSFRNRIINGDMRVDQVNNGAAQTITSAAFQYCLDMMIATASSTSFSGQRVAGAVPDQFLWQATGAGGVTGLSFGTRIESNNIADLASSTVTFSCELSNSLLTTVNWLATYANSTDNFTTTTAIASGSFTVNSSLARYSAQIALPANAVNGIQIALSVGAQTSGTFKVGELQLEAGSIATPFERVPVGLELALCHRYFYRSANNEFIWSGNTTNGVTYYQEYILPTPMRVTPTISNITSAAGFGFPATTAANANTNRSGYYNNNANATQNGSFMYFGADFSARL